MFGGVGENGRFQAAFGEGTGAFMATKKASAKTGRSGSKRKAAEPGVEVCQVAMRKADVPVDDLVPAHVRASRGDLEPS